MGSEMCIRDRLSKITAPTLVMAGERDVHYVAEADLLCSEIVDSRKLIVADAGHALTEQAKEVFEEAVLEFLSIG